MGYNTRKLLRDAEGNPIPQYYDPETDTFKPATGTDSGVVSELKKLNENNGIALQAYDKSLDAMGKSEAAETNSIAAVETANEAKTTSEDVRSQFDLVIAEAGDSNPEVVQARGGEVNLNARLEKVNQNLAQRPTQSEVDNKVAQIVSGSPKAVYSTLTALQTAFPTGTTGIYLVSADGKWYYWNGLGSWVAGGQYQSTGIPTRGVTGDKLEYKTINETKIKGVSVLSNNLFNKDNIKRDRMINSSLQEVTYAGNFLTEFMDCIENTVYRTNFGEMIFYDASLNPISKVNTFDFTTPAGSVYFVGSGGIAYIDNYYVNKGTVNMKDDYKFIIKGLATMALDNQLIQNYNANVQFEGIPYAVSDDFNNWVKFDSVIITTGSYYTKKTWANIVAEIKLINNSYYVIDSPEGVKECVFLNFKRALVFDMAAKKFDIVFWNDKFVNHNYIVIAQNQDSRLAGHFAQYYMSHLEKDRVSKTNYIPRNYLSNIEAKENEIIPLLKENTFMFGFSTDMHVSEWENGHRNMTYNVMSRLKNTLGFDCIINGGDTISYGRTDKAKGYGALKSIMNKFDSRGNFFHIIGNHDYNGRSDAPGGKQLKSWTVTPVETYNILGRHLKDVVWGSKEGMYFYKDFADKKIRIVFLNTSDSGFDWVTDANGDYLRVDPLIVGGIRQTQFEWLCNTALDFSDKDDKHEWHTMVVQHIGAYSDAEGLTWNQQNLENQLALRSLYKSFKNGTSIPITHNDTKYSGNFNLNITTNFATQGAMALIGVWSGHNHLDRIIDSDEIINISTTCGTPDKTLIQKDPSMVRTVNTYNEFALDAVIIDKPQRKVILKRFGAGVDREFTY